MLQHELRIYRHWKCSTCGRSVRTRGAVASRLCECVKPPVFMELIDTPAVGAFDASGFTTYDNEVDATPTERELVEELPEHMMPPPIDTENIKPTFRRGTGYLRAETAPDTETEPDTSVVAESFGAGIEPEAEASSVTETADSEGTGRKRRRRRRRKSREAGDSAAPTENAPQPVAQHESVQASATSVSSESSSEGNEPVEAASSETEGGGDAESSSGAPKRKRRRRRRGKGQ